MKIKQQKANGPVNSKEFRRKREEEKPPKKSKENVGVRKESQETLEKGYGGGNSEIIRFTREFDPGSGRTLAACLTHASRTESSKLASST